MKTEKMVMVIDGGLPVRDDLLIRIVNAAAAKSQMEDIAKLVEVFHVVKQLAENDRYVQELLS